MIQGICDGKLRALAKAITLIESQRPEDQQATASILEAVLPRTGSSLRIGISGVPGAGKSTFIEAFGMYLLQQGKRVAVLAVDPSSQLSGGSILGDKTRMEELSRQECAFIRPSPSGETLGGVARKTRESMLLCEAYGFDVIIVETVGVGQSETAVASMVDFFLLLQLPGAGDELQGIKKGVMEIADGIVVNKADGDNVERARLAARQMENALHIMTPKSPSWTVPVELVSALHKSGMDLVWQMLQDYLEAMRASGEFEQKRKNQAVDWMWSTVMDNLKYAFSTHPKVAAALPELQRSVAEGVTTPGIAARKLLEVFRRPM
nr:methylmalonyl Co-A mutase-associated GTPase MeaB [Desulfurispira natronophila]